jgi:hypothetical protein
MLTGLDKFMIKMSAAVTISEPVMRCNELGYHLHPSFIFKVTKTVYVLPLTLQMSIKWKLQNKVQQQQQHAAIPSFLIPSRRAVVHICSG